MDISKKLVVKGVFWTGIQLIINQGFAFIIRLVLARLLFPEQFGLVGMATVFTGFVQVLNDLGIGAALVQRQEKNLREGHFHTSFWTGVVWSVALYAIICLAVAPLAASFYKEPFLTKIIPVLSLGVLFSPVNMVNRAQLTKQMNFKKIAIIDNTSNIIAGCIALLLAFLGAGIWSLVFNSVASLIVGMPLYFKATGWKPRWLWDKTAFKDIFGFGIYTTGTNLVNYLMNNIDYLLIGKLLSAHALGAYTFAFVLTDTFRTRLMAVINNVMYPMYGRLQSSPETIKKYYLKVVNYNSIVVYPFMVFMFTLGKPFIISLFGTKWIESIVPLQILAISVMVHMLVNSNTALIRGMGRPDLEMKLQVFKSLIFVPSLFFGIRYYGIIGGAWAVLLNKIIAVLIAQFTFNQLLKIRVTTTEFLSSIKVPWISSLTAYLVGSFLYVQCGVHYIVAAVFLGGTYLLSVWLMMGKRLTAELNNLRNA